MLELVCLEARSSSEVGGKTACWHLYVSQSLGQSNVSLTCKQMKLNPTTAASRAQKGLVLLNKTVRHHVCISKTLYDCVAAVQTDEGPCTHALIGYMGICGQYSWLQPVPFQQETPQSALFKDGPNTLSISRAQH